jgi:uncharacterized membrane protein
MILIKIIVSALCLTVAVWIAVYKIRKITKEERAKGYTYIPLEDYDRFFYYDIWYSAGFLIIAAMYDFQPRTNLSGWFITFFLPLICFASAYFGKRLNIWETKQAMIEERYRVQFKKIKELRKKSV